MFVKRIEDLIIYTIALKLGEDINKLTNKIPYSWNVKEVSQIKRSASSVAANIAEGFGQRFYVKQFIHYLYIAVGSSDETQSHLRKLKRDGHTGSSEANFYLKRYKNLSVKIVNLISYLRKRYNINHIK